MYMVIGYMLMGVRGIWARDLDPGLGPWLWLWRARGLDRASRSRSRVEPRPEIEHRPLGPRSRIELQIALVIATSSRLSSASR